MGNAGALFALAFQIGRAAIAEQSIDDFSGFEVETTDFDHNICLFEDDGAGQASRRRGTFHEHAQIQDRFANVAYRCLGRRSSTSACCTIWMTLV
jgi:hypothetical protein